MSRLMLYIHSISTLSLYSVIKTIHCTLLLQSYRRNPESWKIVAHQSFLSSSRTTKGLRLTHQHPHPSLAPHYEISLQPNPTLISSHLPQYFPPPSPPIRPYISSSKSSSPFPFHPTHPPLSRKPPPIIRHLPLKQPQILQQFLHVRLHFLGLFVLIGG